MQFRLFIRDSSLIQSDNVVANPLETSTSIGYLGFTKSRVKRDGRNPSTGSRGSRKYYNNSYWALGIPPLQGINNLFIY